MVAAATAEVDAASDGALIVAEGSTVTEHDELAVVIAGEEGAVPENGVRSEFATFRKRVLPEQISVQAVEGDNAVGAVESDHDDVF